jgi:anthranilate synthase component 2
VQVLLIDNYDSFTYNIVQILEESRLCNYKVLKNDELNLEAIDNFDKIIISPGPGVSAETKNLKEVIKKYHQTKPVLGICLGHQAIGEFFDAKLIKLDKILHGEESEIQVYAK